ncbi:MAG: RHS repeat-associated core domain-containing protein [Acidobacteriota bacterium]
MSMKRISLFRRSLVRLMIFGALFSLGAFAIRAADKNKAPERGFHPGGSYALSEIETISRSSGELSINLPLGSLPSGRGGLSAGLNLLYSSKVWDTAEMIDYTAQGLPYDASRLILSEEGGWRYGFQYRLKIDYLKLGELQGYCDASYDYPYKLVLITPDGGKHPLWLDNHTNSDGYMDVWPDGRPACGGNGTGGGVLTYYTYDGTYMRLDFVTDGDDNWMNNSWTLSLPNGMRVLGGPIAGTTAIQRIIDRNDNYLDIFDIASDSNYNFHPTITLKDQLNRSIVLEYNYATNQDAIHVKGINAVEMLVIVQWKTITVHKVYNSSNVYPNFSLNTNIRVVDKVYLPSQAGNLFYTFDYNADAVSNPSVGWGELSSVTLPSGAGATYNYEQDNASGSTIYTYHVLRNRPTQKTLGYNAEYDGTSTPVTETWTYGTTYATPGDSAVIETTITGPDNGISKEYPNKGANGAAIPTETGKTINLDGTVIERVYANNFPSGMAVFSNLLVNRFVKYEFTSIKNAAGTLTKTAIKEYKYDKNGNVTQVKEYDWASYGNVPRDTYGQPTGLPAGATPLRVTINDYYNQTPDSAVTTVSPYAYSQPASPRLRTAIKSSEVQDGGETAFTRSESFYDNASTTGNLTTAKSWDSTKGSITRPLTAGNSISVTNTYSASGNVLTSTDGRNIQTQFTYGNINGFTDLYPTQVVAAFGSAVARTTTTEYDFTTGLATRVTDADNNVATATTYDVFGRPTLVKAAEGKAEETRTTMEYSDTNRRVISRSDLTTLGDGKLVSIKHYDQLGRLRLSRQLEDAATQSATDEMQGIKVQTRYAFSGANSYALSSNPYRANTSGQATTEETMGWSRSKSDNGGRLIEAETFSGTALPAPWGSSAASTGKVVTGYDANVTTVTDQASKKRRSTIDGLGRLTQVEELYENGTLYATTSYLYDTLDNLAKVTQGTAPNTQIRYFMYDSLKRLRRAKNPETDVNSGLNLFDLVTGNSSWSAGYSYDNDSNLTGKVDPRGITTTYSYDSLNRVVSRSYTSDPQFTPTVTYTYDDVNVAYAKGRLTRVSSSVSAYDYLEYDALGRVKQSKQTTAGNEYPMLYQYNKAGAMTSETYPSGRVITTSYDAAGRLSNLSGAKTGESAKTYASQLNYTSHGAVASMKIGNHPTNPRYEHTSFNSRLQPTQIGLGTTASDASLLRLDYTYGTTTNNGNVLSQRIVLSGLDVTQTYSYDQVNRLLTAEEKTTSGQVQQWKQAFTYDQFGNRNFDVANTTLLEANPSISSSTNRINAANYLYDNAGNVTQEPSAPTHKAYVYDAENHQKEYSYNSQTWRYEYDGDGRRVKKIKPDNSSLVCVYDAGGRLVAEYDSGTSAPSAYQTNFLTQDHLGSTRAVSDATGAVTSRLDYLPFGTEISAGIGGRTTAMMYSASTTLRQKFTGHERDEESKLDFAQARYCSSVTGRFMSADDFLNDTHVSDPQSWNLYVYVRNNPLRFVDSAGEEIEKKDGKVKFDSSGKTVTATFETGTREVVINGKKETRTVTIKGKFVEGTVYSTNNGKTTEIQAYQSKGPLQVVETNEKGETTFSGTVDEYEQYSNITHFRGWNNTSNCHGTTFANGEVWIQDNQVKKLMTAEGYDINNPSSIPTKDAVGIFSTDGGLADPRHSVKVLDLNPTMVESKGGVYPKEITTPAKSWTDTDPSRKNHKLLYYTKKVTK